MWNTVYDKSFIFQSAAYATSQDFEFQINQHPATFLAVVSPKDERIGARYGIELRRTLPPQANFKEGYFGSSGAYQKAFLVSDATAESNNPIENGPGC